MKVKQLAAPHSEKVVGVLKELLERAESGELVSLAYIAEPIKGRPECGIVGRYRREPARCLGEINVMAERLARYIASTNPDALTVR